MAELPIALKGHHAFLLHEVLEGIDDAVLIFDRDRRIVYANEGAAEAFKEDASALLGRTMGALVPVDDRPRFKQIIVALDASKDDAIELHNKSEFIGRQSNGHTFYAEGRLVKMGGKLSYVLVLQDITWKRALETELEKVMLHLQKAGLRAKHRLENPAILEEFPLD